MEGISATARAYAEVGVRVVMAPMMADTSLYQAIPGLLESLPKPHRSNAEKAQFAPWQNHIDGCRALPQDWPVDRDQVRPALGPAIPHHCSDDFIRACRDLVPEYGVGIQMHLADSKVQAMAGLKLYGKTLTAHLDDLGLIGPVFTGAHCIWLDGDDVKRFSDRGASVAYNPGSNLRLGNGVAPARHMLNSGVTVGIGSDGSASANHQNMFGAMQMASFVSRLDDPDPETWLGTWDVLRAGILSGASALGMSGMVGRLAPGFKADSVFVDLTNINFVPLNNVANQIVNFEDSSAVDDVMIGGRMVLQRRRFVSIDFDKLCHDVQATVEAYENKTHQPKAAWKPWPNSSPLTVSA